MAEITEVPALPRIPTGSRARQALQDRIKNLAKIVDPGEDEFFPIDTRSAKRRQVREEKRQAKRGRRAYVRQELAKERAASDLANLFRIVDREVPSSRAAYQRANDAIAARIRYIRDQNEVRYGGEWAARQANRDLPAPKPVIRHDEVYKQLRALAEPVTPVLPKEKKKYNRGGFLPRGLTTVVNNTGRDIQVDTGRTGRAG